MKVLGLCSGRKNGNTEIMMKEAFMAIEEKCGAECQLVRIQETTINTCTGCESCMINHLKGNWDFRCVHKNGSDHFYFIEQLMREADAIIVSSPAYNLLPTGQLIKFLNKMHASGNYRDVVEKENKIGAAFSLGGTDWTNFTLNVCKMIAMELTGSYEALVDAVHFDFVPLLPFEGAFAFFWRNSGHSAVNGCVDTEYCPIYPRKPTVLQKSIYN